MDQSPDDSFVDSWPAHVATDAQRTWRTPSAAWMGTVVAGASLTMSVANERRPGTGVVDR